jgi:hypothetical protein
MKQRLVLIALVVMTASIAARAQDSDVRVGLGVSMTQNLSILGTDNLFYPVNFTSFSIPLFLTKNFRVEPVFGMVTHSFERTYTDNSVSSNSSSQMRIGAGFHYMFRNIGGSESVMAYVGPHVDFLPYSDKSKGSSPTSVEVTTTRSDLVLGLACGGEYFFAKCFSLGTDVQFNYISIGEESVSPDPTPSTSTVKEHFMNISTAVTARLYFN